MSTETQVTTTETAPIGGGDEFTAEEKAFFDSRGEKPLGEAPAATNDRARDAAADKAAGVDGSDDAETLEIDESGRPRDSKTGRWVRHGAFHKEREGRKVAETKLAEKDVALAKVTERLNLLSQALDGGVDPAAGKPAAAAAKTNDDPMPDMEKDIIGFVKWQAREIDRLKKGFEEGTQATTAKLSDMQQGQAYRSDAVAFHKTQPDFGGAYMHLVGAMHRELELMGIADETQRATEISRMEREQVAFALKNGKRPAEHIYRLAEARGWKAPAKTEGSPAAETKTEQNAANDAAAAELDRLQKGQNAARSLSGAGGSAPAQLTAEAIASMTEGEFDALLKKTHGSRNVAMRRLMGG